MFERFTVLTLWTSWQDGWQDITGSMSSASSSLPRRAVPVWSGQPAITVMYS